MKHLYMNQEIMKMLTPDVRFTVTDGKLGYTLTDTIEEGRSTIIRVLDCITKKQERFIREGFEALKPMTMGDLGAALKLDESSISVALSDLYMETSFGIYPVKVVVGTGFYKTKAGVKLSRIVVLKRIQDLVAMEDKAAPLSDSELSVTLALEGIDLTRRTVVKYRQELDIPDLESRRQDS